MDFAARTSANVIQNLTVAMFSLHNELINLANWGSRHAKAEKHPKMMKLRQQLFKMKTTDDSEEEQNDDK